MHVRAHNTGHENPRKLQFHAWAAIGADHAGEICKFPLLRRSFNDKLLGLSYFVSTWTSASTECSDVRRVSSRSGCYRRLFLVSCKFSFRSDGTLFHESNRHFGIVSKSRNVVTLKWKLGVAVYKQRHEMEVCNLYRSKCNQRRSRGLSVFYLRCLKYF